MHAQVDDPGVEVRRGLRIERALPVWHDALGLIGKADVVEFEPDGTPYPVEYKHGSRHKAADIAACDDVQLAAQALCLEAMTGRAVCEGAIYYASSKRRRVVPITAELRRQVAEFVREVRGMLESTVLPPPTIREPRATAAYLEGSRFAQVLVLKRDVLPDQAIDRGHSRFATQVRAIPEDFRRRASAWKRGVARPSRAARELQPLQSFSLRYTLRSRGPHGERENYDQFRAKGGSRTLDAVVAAKTMIQINRML